MSTIKICEELQYMIKQRRSIKHIERLQRRLWLVTDLIRDGVRTSRELVLESGLASNKIRWALLFLRQHRDLKKITLGNSQYDVRYRFVDETPLKPPKRPVRGRNNILVYDYLKSHPGLMAYEIHPNISLGASQVRNALGQLKLNDNIKQEGGGYYCV